MDAIASQVATIELDNIVFRCTRREKTFLTPPLSKVFFEGDRIAILSTNRKIRNEFLGLIYGLIPPVSGSLIPYRTISWPIGLRGGLDKKLTLSQNMHFIANVYDDCVAPLNLDRFLKTFLSFADLSPEQRLKDLRSKDQKIFYMIVSLAFNFDVFLVPSGQFIVSNEKNKINQYLKTVFDARIENQSLITSSPNKKFLKQYCNQGLVLDESGALAFEGELDDCFARLRELSRQTAQDDDDDDSIDESDFSESLTNEERDSELFDII